MCFRVSFTLSSFVLLRWGGGVLEVLFLSIVFFYEGNMFWTAFLFYRFMSLFCAPSVFLLRVVVWKVFFSSGFFIIAIKLFLLLLL